jgi:membrane-bound serine protease (ClpP class)
MILAVLALFLAALPTLAQEPSTRPATDDSSARRAVVIVADGTVDNFMRNSIERRVGEARDLGADAVILKIDTYGGLVTAGLEISRFLKQLDLPVLAFVDDKAISAGALISLAADEIAMEPASMIGDSGVIAMAPGGGQQTLGDTERAKVESPVLADFDDSARRNGYSDLLAASFVRTDLVVFAIEHVETGEIRFVDRADHDSLVSGGMFGEPEEAVWRDLPGVPVPLDDEQSLLTMSDEVAQKIGLSIGTFADAEALAAAKGWTIVATLQPSGGERLVGFLGGFAVRGILVTVLLFSAYASFSSPGTGVPEVVAAISAGVLFGVPWLTGFAQWYEVLLVLVGLALIAVEIFVLPGFGVFGISGLIAVLGGMAMTFVGPIVLPGLPTGYGVDWSNLAWGMLCVLLGMGLSLLLWLWLAKYVAYLPGAGRLVLQDDEPGEEALARAAVEAWPPIGSTGTAVTDLRPGGTARFAITDVAGDTANADVVSDRGFIEAGTGLVVVEVAGNRVVVRPGARTV